VSIVAYTGLPGAGKTYAVVEHQILPALKAGRTVVTNVPLRDEAIAALGYSGTVVQFPVEAVTAEPHRIKEFVTAGSVFVLDEVWRLFPQGQQANKVPDEYKSLLAEHRHMVDAAGNSTQIVFVVQDLANIGAFARRLVENTFVTTKLGFVGLNGSYRVDIFHAGVTGAAPPVSNRLRFVMGRYRKEIFQLYKSHTMATDDAAGGANEKKIDGRANILLRPAFVVGAIAVPLLLWFSIHTFTKAFHGSTALVKTGAPVGPTADGARNGVERAAPAGPVWAARQGDMPPEPRILLESEDSSRPGETEVLFSDGKRLIRLSGSACRHFARSIRCAWKGAYYDAAGYVEPIAQGPLAKPAAP
jgi:zona occludens toxin (predicted ATPase)